MLSQAVNTELSNCMPEDDVKPKARQNRPLLRHRKPLDGHRKPLLRHRKPLDGQKTSSLGRRKKTLLGKKDAPTQAKQAAAVQKEPHISKRKKTFVWQFN